MKRIEKLLPPLQKANVCKKIKIKTMRTKNTIKNSLVTLAFQIVILLVGFIVPRWIIAVFGSVINGLTSNINQILTMINLLQAGLVGASIFEMYKPISQNDYKQVGSIYYSSEKYFKKTSYVFFILTLFMIPYLFFDKNSGLSLLEIVCSVLILGINATFIFRYYCKYDVIFSAHQQKYILILATAAEKIVYYGLLTVVLYFKMHYLLMYIAVFIGSLVRVLILEQKFNKLYKEKIASGKELTNYKLKNQYHLFGNQIVQNMIESLPVICVTIFSGLKYASVLSVYLIVSNVFKMIFSTLQNAVAASFGDLAARAEHSKTLEVFSLIQVFFSGGAIIIYTCLMFLYLSFINIYCKGASDFSYVFPELGIWITLYIVCFTSFLPFNLMINSLGLYGKVLKMNIINGIISLCIMLITSFFDFQFVYIGPAFFYFLSIIHRYFVLRKNNVDLKKKHLVNGLFPIFVVMLEGKSMIHMPIIDKPFKWLLLAIIIATLATIFVMIMCVIFRKDELKELKKYAESILKRGIDS